MSKEEETTLEDRAILGSHYKTFLDSEITQRCLADQERYYFEALLAEENEANVLKLWHRMKAGERFKESIQFQISDGAAASAEIRRKDALRDKGPAGKPLIQTREES